LGGTASVSTVSGRRAGPDGEEAGGGEKNMSFTIHVEGGDRQVAAYGVHREARELKALTLTEISNGTCSFHQAPAFHDSHGTQYQYESGFNFSGLLVSGWKHCVRWLLALLLKLHALQVASPPIPRQRQHGVDPCSIVNFTSRAAKPPETKRRIRCGPIRRNPEVAQAQRTEAPPNQTIQRRRVHRRGSGGSPTKSPRRTRYGEGHVKHARAPSPVFVDDPRDASSTLPIRAIERTYVLRPGAEASWQLVTFPGLPTMRAAARWRRIESESRVWWCAVPSRSARTYQHRRPGRRRCRRPFHPLVGAVRRGSRSRNGPRFVGA
jgi:hypothetical protein